VRATLITHLGEWRAEVGVPLLQHLPVIAPRRGIGVHHAPSRASTTTLCRNPKSGALPNRVPSKSGCPLGVEAALLGRSWLWCWQRRGWVWGVAGGSGPGLAAAHSKWRGEAEAEGGPRPPTPSGMDGTGLGFQFRVLGFRVSGCPASGHRGGVPTGAALTSERALDLRHPAPTPPLSCPPAFVGRHGEEQE